MKSLALLSLGILFTSFSALAEGDSKFGPLGDSVERAAKEVGHKLGVVRTHPLNETPTPSPSPAVVASPTASPKPTATVKPTVSPSPSASPIEKMKK